MNKPLFYVCAVVAAAPFVAAVGFLVWSFGALLWLIHPALPFAVPVWLAAMIYAMPHGPRPGGHRAGPR